MEGIAAEVSQKLKSAIKAKLMELGAYVDEELPNYVMVMVTNRRSKAEMDRELNLFLGGNTATFTTWLQSVWTKLEQVTVANLEKKKPIDKKKKIKKSTRSSSESEDDRKHKKKRKSANATDVSVKESKKRKSVKNECMETESGVFVEDISEDGDKKSRDAIKNDIRSNVADLESDNDIGDINIEKKKFLKEPTILDEDDFLNIKEDFESEFLSDEEIESKAKLKQSLDLKKSLKCTDKVDVLISNKKHSPSDKSVKNDPDKTSDKLKNKENKNSANSIPKVKETVMCPAKSVSKTILIRNRKVVRSPSRSRSVTRPSISPEKLQSHQDSKSISPAPSPTRSPPVTSNIIKIREKSPVLDARELINRKRALLHAIERSSKVDGIPVKRALLAAQNNNDAIPVHDVTEKENDLRRAHTENISDVKTDKQVENKFGRVILNRLEGKRSVIGDERFSSISRTKNDKIDLRKIKRTVYVRSEDDEPKEANEQMKIHKSMVNQIVKYIKDEPVVSGNTTMSATKVPKINRSKVATDVRSAGSTLIRKAMADAHKSLTTKEEPLKKKDIHDIKYKTSLHVKKDENKNAPSKEHLQSDLIEDDSNDVEVVSSDTLIGVDPEDEESTSPKIEEDSEESRLNPVSVEVEEYDPSQTIPTFVVTLTGLDPKLYPEDNMEPNESFSTESNQIDQQEFYSDFEENKIKAKISEQCKYYPNCLAGDQCLYHHPTIPCKMFPNCKFGNSCLYMHPKCKFDAACTRYDCPFLHTATRMTVPVATRHAAQSSTINAQPCKFYYNCVNPICPFQHPKICRYDRHCMNKNCTYQHTSLSHVNAFSKDKLKWSKPKNDAEEAKQSENYANEL